MTSTVRRFLFEGLDIRGAIVHLGDAWQQMQAGRDYQPTVAQLLGETAAVTALIAAQLKQPGRLTLQLRGNGPIQLLVMDCNEQLQMRGMARSNPVVLPAPVPELLGAHQGGQLLMSLDLPTARQPYQSYVPLVGDSISAIFEHYLEQSEQQPAGLWLAANEHAAAALFVQKLPGADVKDLDGWSRVQQLAHTVRKDELLGLEPQEILRRLFAEENVRLFEPRAVTHDWPADPEKVATMLRSLGEDEVRAILAEHGEIVVHDDMSNHTYRFDAADVDALFQPRTLH